MSLRLIKSVTVIVSSTVFALLLSSARGQSPDSKKRAFFEDVRVLRVDESKGEVTLVDGQGRLRSFKKGDRIEEEGAILKEATRASLVLTRPVTGSNGERGQSLIVVKIGVSGRVKVREYLPFSDAPVPAPPRDFT